MLIESFKKAWRGEEKLWKVFWLWFLLGNTTWVFIYCYVPANYNSSLTHFMGRVGLFEIFFYMPSSILLIFINIKNTIKIYTRILSGLVAILISLSFYIVIIVTWQLSHTEPGIRGFYKYIAPF